MVWKVVTPPATEPASLAEVKGHLQVDSTERDEEITNLIAAAREFIEQTCNRALMPQTWEVSLPGFGRGEVLLPGGNVRAIDSITYFDAENIEQTLDAADYFGLLTEPAKIAPNCEWPCTYRRPDAVTITIQVGYTDAANVPSPLKSALKLHVELLFDRPVGPDMDALQRARDALLFPYIDGRILT